MRTLPILLFVCLTAVSAIAEDSPTAVVQKLFDAMSKHDAEMARTLFLPEAMLFSVRPDGTSSATPHQKWVERMGASKDAWLERIWSPTALEHGTVAVVWAQFDFHLNGKFSHCGIDSFSLLKTAAGWKIAGVADTHETTGCAPSPLGPPPAK
jgi:hypothetical protein